MGRSYAAIEGWRAERGGFRGGWARYNILGKSQKVDGQLFMTNRLVHIFSSFNIYFLYIIYIMYLE